MWRGGGRRAVRGVGAYVPCRNMSSGGGGGVVQRVGDGVRKVWQDPRVQAGLRTGLEAGGRGARLVAGYGMEAARRAGVGLWRMWEERRKGRSNGMDKDKSWMGSGEEQKEKGTPISEKKLKNEFDRFLRSSLLESGDHGAAVSGGGPGSSWDRKRSLLFREAGRSFKSAFDMPNPDKVVAELDRFIVGQEEAKRAVAISLRNRWRRHQLQSEELRNSIIPKNILMIGSTGVGKTEIARQVAEISGAPFVKVEATKFATNRWRHSTAGGQDAKVVSKEFGSVVEDLLEVAVKSVKENMKVKVKDKLALAVEDRLLDALETFSGGFGHDEEEEEGEGGGRQLKRQKRSSSSMGYSRQVRESYRNMYRKMIRNGRMDNRTIPIDLFEGPHGSGSAVVGTGAALVPMDFHALEAERMRRGLLKGREGSEGRLGGVYDFMKRTWDRMVAKEMLNRPHKRVRVKVSEALAIVADIEADKLLDNDEVIQTAKRSVEQDGIIFIEEIDKLCISLDGSRGEYGVRMSSDDRYAELLQRDLLPLLEGCVVSTKYGPVKTDHMLFIASGAFHNAQPSMLLPELQGRLPIRVQLKPLSEDDLYTILTREDKNNLIKQQVELLKTEGVYLEFDNDAIREISRIAFEVNNALENIGARRLNTIIERVVEGISFCAPNINPQNYASFADTLNSNQALMGVPRTGKPSILQSARTPPSVMGGYVPPPRESEIDGHADILQSFSSSATSDFFDNQSTDRERNEELELMRESLGRGPATSSMGPSFGDSATPGAESPTPTTGLVLSLKCIDKNGRLLDLSSHEAVSDTNDPGVNCEPHETNKEVHPLCGSVYVHVLVNKEHVQKSVGDLFLKTDLSRFVL
eukprot:Nk52_evm15s211 gene=Nk52_evmTU15s211